ncbi:MAG: class I SAM-dependent methyltransferase [Bacteroidia bacterium]|nr:class I SAM-dependent methyltransferase [Bacteroidia bacterium]
MLNEKAQTAFSEEQNRNVYLDGIEKNFWHVARNQLLLCFFGRWRAEPLLEIGAGRGFVLAAFQEAGWEVEGIDLTYAEPRWPTLPISYGKDVFDTPLEYRARFRGVALFDTLEHIPDRVGFLVRLRESFPSLEHLYLTLPARQELWSNYDEYYGHYLRYTPVILSYELGQAGYRLVFCRYFFHLLYWILRLYLLLNKRRQESMNPPRGFSVFLHRVIGKFFYWEGLLLPGEWRGSSLLAVAQPIR